MVVNYDWKDDAACTGIDPAFDTDFIRAPHVWVCETCPVRMDCLDDALRFIRDGDFGIWGGLSRDQRNLVRTRKSDYESLWQANLAKAALWRMKDDDGCDGESEGEPCGAGCCEGSETVWLDGTNFP